MSSDQTIDPILGTPVSGSSRLKQIGLPHGKGLRVFSGSELAGRMGEIVNPPEAR